MKKIVPALIFGLFIIACTDNKQQQKQLLNEVIKIHDGVMNADEALMKNKMKLDTLLIEARQQHQDTVEIKALSNALAQADADMGKWMHQFNPDLTGKPENEALNYLETQKKQIKAIDAQIKAAVAQSNQYLAKITSK